MLTRWIPSDVQVEHVRRPYSFRCSSGTCTLSRPLQMFKWNMYTRRFPQMFKWNINVWRPSSKCSSGTWTLNGIPQMFQSNMYAGRIPSDVPVEYVRLTDSLNCSNKTWTPGGSTEMFKWNMYTWRSIRMFHWIMLTCQIPSDVHMEHVHLTASHKRFIGPWTLAGFHQMFTWNMYTCRFPQRFKWNINA